MSMRWARTRHDGCQQHNAQRTYATSTTRCAPSWRASFFVARPRASTAMMQGQGGKRGPDRNPRKRKKETKAAKQRKAKNKKLHAQAQSKAAKRGLIQLMAFCNPAPMPADPENSSAQDDVQIVGQTNVGASANALPARRASERMVIVGKTQGRERSEGARRAEGQSAAMAQKQVGDGGHASSRHILCQPNSRVHCTHLVVAACACVHQTSRGRCGTLPHCTAAPVECRVYWTVLFGC